MKGTRDSNYELVYDFGLIAYIDDHFLHYYVICKEGAYPKESAKTETAWPTLVEIVWGFLGRSKLRAVADGSF